MSIRFPLIAAVLAVSLAGCAGEKLWMKAGAGPVEANDDEMSCAASSEGGSGVSINATGAGFAPDQFSMRYSCLRSRGYKLVTVTPEESAKLRALSGEEHEIYWRSLQAKYGVAAAP
ncbi:MAG TPA: hypothetical protein VGC51_12750 [Hansschlegelia sp.]